MTRIFLSLILGILPQALFFMMFITKTKEIKSKRILLTILFYIIIALMVMITRYSLYLYLLIIPLMYGTMKLLYKRKVQIIDIFIIAAGYGRNRRTSYRNYRSQEDYYNLMEDIVDDGMELARAYEDASEMTNNQMHKNKLMKIAEREKEHYKMAKEMLENKM